MFHLEDRLIDEAELGNLDFHKAIDWNEVNSILEEKRRESKELLLETCMTDMPKTSIIVPVYKAEKYLRRCIESIVHQTYTDWELLLVDDGSPDGSGGICDEFAGRDARILVFHKENGGVSSARNLGLENIRGEYVTFVDSDDMIDARTLEICMSRCEGLEMLQFSFSRNAADLDPAENSEPEIFANRDYVNKCRPTQVRLGNSLQLRYHPPEPYQVR